MDYAAAPDKPAKPKHNGADLAKEGGKWIERVRASEKREHQWREDAKAAEKAFACNTEDQDSKGVLYDFNILHSNVETIVPAIYNSTPIADVRRRWIEAIGEPPQDPTPQILQEAAKAANIPPEQAQQMMQSPQGKQMAAQVLQSPPARQALAQYQQAMQAFQAKQQRDKDFKTLGDVIERAITVQIDDNKLDKEVEREAQDSFLAGRGVLRVKFDMADEAKEEGAEQSGERTEFEAVSWRDFRMGQATRWADVPWIAFRKVVPRETMELYTDEEVYSAQPQTDYDKNPGEGDDVTFWEIWCKYEKVVKFVREHDSKILKVTDDPLGLSGFYPIPEPVQPIALTGRLTPVCPFTIYKTLADELDRITKRINGIMKGLKVRGLVAGQASKILELQNAGDNEIVVDSDLEGLAQVGLDKAVLWWPIEQGIKVLKELYQQREIVKASIYEITGISDIIRGASNANETLGAQEIKTQWGALRIQKMQRMIERQVRDVFGMMAELILSKFSEKTLVAMTGIEFTDGMRALMQQPVLTSYRVDVESDSTVRADLTRQKQDMSEFITGTANFFKTMEPLVGRSPEAAEPIVDIYSSMASVFKLGRQAEDALEKLSEIAKKAAKQPPPPNPEAEKAKAEMAMMDKEFSLKEKEAKLTADLKMKEGQMKEAEGAARIQLERELAQIKKEIATLELQMKQAEIGMKQQEAAIGLQTKQAESAIKLQTAGQQAQVKAAQGQQSIEQAREMGAIKAEQAKKPKAKADA